MTLEQTGLTGPDGFYENHLGLLREFARSSQTRQPAEADGFDLLS